ncbi:hypothetical protein LXA43DRAFT_522529 [Ganoderma leucocontextum]|nr:hypothetical protein LXA43DRAFT_522529 [Ganoderma leucocontextum]
MTSYVLEAHESRNTIPDPWRTDPRRCAFCKITHGEGGPAYKIYEEHRHRYLRHRTPAPWAHTCDSKDPYFPCVGAVGRVYCGLRHGGWRVPLSTGALQNTALNVVCTKSKHRLFQTSTTTSFPLLNLASTPAQAWTRQWHWRTRPNIATE